ncbi:MAG: hypothetical protein MJZ65_01480 [Paludibacteraceae bacterium]|nr:hypothetical protein [Paludibacteraceae bacterium]
MKKGIFSMAMVFTTMSVFGASIKYNGGSLTQDNRFTRSECGTAYKKVIPEVSGMACSRTTPGYLWIHGDENIDFTGITAINPDGTKVMTLTFNSGTTSRDDWEDICTGVYNNKNYVFVGAFGDNDGKFKDNYIIYYFEEPTITSGSKSIAVNYIKFGYPDNKAHNTETLMYDNIEQMFYVVDKIKGGVCTLYKLPFATNYGTSVQKLTKVQELGQSGDNFDYCTAGDITPDGKWMIIKNKPFALIWERQGNESITATVARAPKQIAAYKEEKQGESVAWLDSLTFYTTSDQDTDVPIYKYTRPANSGQQQGGGDDPIVTPTGDSTQCGTIIKAVYEIDSKTNATVTGTIGGTADVKLSESGKLDKSKYFGITLAAGHFHVGDVVTYTMSKAADLENTYMIVYADKDRNTIIYENKDILGGTTLSFTVSQMVKSIYLSRPDGAGWNPYISSVAVTRKCDQESTALKSVNTHSVATKFMHKGHLYLRRGQDIYTTQGQKM